MITTRFGSEVVINGVDRSGVWTEVRRIDDGADREFLISDLRADTVDELESALSAAPIYDAPPKKLAAIS